MEKAGKHQEIFDTLSDLECKLYYTTCNLEGLPFEIEHALKLLENNSYSQVVKMTGISKSTIIRAKRNKVSQEILNSL